MNLWLEAVKEWNATKNKGTYKIPKKDTAEYRQVKAIMSKLEKKHKKSIKGSGFFSTLGHMFADNRRRLKERQDKLAQQNK